MTKKASSDDELEPVEGLSCPRCRATHVVELPADGISPHPGYRCLSCGSRLRGMTFTFVLVILLGLGLLSMATGIVKVFGDDRDETLRGYVLSPMGTWSSFVVIPLYVLLVAYAVRQLLRPRPRRG